MPDLDTLHIKLICWDHAHVQVISDIQLRTLKAAPTCTALQDEGDVCGSAIWAVKHEGEPARYVGRPPHRNWEAWADCLAPLAKS